MEYRANASLPVADLTGGLPQASPLAPDAGCDQRPSFDDPDLLVRLRSADAAALDRLDFGVIGFDSATNVTHYNRAEAASAGLAAPRVLSRPLFRVVAPCMNNVIVAGRFDAAQQAGVGLDVLLDYMLALRMRPIRVQLRLLAGPVDGTRFVAVQWAPTARAGR